MKLSERTFNKAKDILYLDKLKSSSGVENVLASEIYYVLKQYFEIDPQSYVSHVHMEQDGCLNINFAFKAKRVLIKRETMDIL